MQERLQEALFREQRDNEALRTKIEADVAVQAGLRQHLTAEVRVEAGLRDQLAADASVEAALREQLAAETTTEANLQDQIAADHAVEAALREQLAAEAAVEASLQARIAADAQVEAGLRQQLAAKEEAQQHLEASLAEAKAGDEADDELVLRLESQLAEAKAAATAAGTELAGAKAAADAAMAELHEAKVSAAAAVAAATKASAASPSGGTLVNFTAESGVVATEGAAAPVSAVDVAAAAPGAAYGASVDSSDSAAAKTVAKGVSFTVSTGDDAPVSADANADGTDAGNIETADAGPEDDDDEAEAEAEAEAEPFTGEPVAFDEEEDYVENMEQKRKESILLLEQMREEEAKELAETAEMRAVEEAAKQQEEEDDLAEAFIRASVAVPNDVDDAATGDGHDATPEQASEAAAATAVAAGLQQQLAAKEEEQQELEACLAEAKAEGDVDDARVLQLESMLADASAAASAAGTELTDVKAAAAKVELEAGAVAAEGGTMSPEANESEKAPSPRAQARSDDDAGRLELRLARVEAAAAGCNDTAASAADVATFVEALRANGAARSAVLAQHSDLITSRLASRQRALDRWRMLWKKQAGGEVEERWRIFNRNVRTLIATKRGEGIFGRSITVLHPVGVAARWRKLRLRARLQSVLVNAALKADPRAEVDRNQLGEKAMRMVNKYGNEELKLFAAVSAKYGLEDSVPEWDELLARYPADWPREFEAGGSNKRVEGEENIFLFYQSVLLNTSLILMPIYLLIILLGEMHIAAVVVQTGFRQHRDYAHAKVHAGGVECKHCNATSNWHFLCDRVMEPLVQEAAEASFSAMRRQLRLLIDQSQGRGILGRSVNPVTKGAGLIGIAARWRRRRLITRLTAFYVDNLPPQFARPKNVPRQVRKLLKSYGDTELKLCAAIQGKYEVDVPMWPVPTKARDALHDLARLPLNASDVDAEGGVEALRKRVRVIRRHLRSIALAPRKPNDAKYLNVDILVTTIVQT